MNRQGEKSIGLVFAGGGGKGSYQIGVWKALREIGVESSISHVSGTSVGALNACFFSMGALNQAVSVWNSIVNEDVMNIDPNKIGTFVARLGMLGITGTLTDSALRLFGKNRSDGVFSRKKLEKLIEYEIDFNAIQNSTVKAYATCFQKSSLSAAYFNLNSQSAETIRSILLATSAIPIIFESHSIENQEYFDGGLIDNTPIKPLYDEGIRNFIIVHLSQSSVIDQNAYPGSRFLEIVPQRDTGNLFSGTLNFNQKKIQERMIDGYTDAMTLLRSYKNTFRYEDTVHEKIDEIHESFQHFDAKQIYSAKKLKMLRTQRKDLLSQCEDIFNKEK